MPDSLLDALFTERNADRRNVARLLHDTLAQGLVALSMQVSRMTGSPNGPGVPEEAARAEALLRNCCSDARVLAYIFSTSGQGLGNAGLVETLEDSVDYLRLEAGLDVEFESEGADQPVPERVRSVLHSAVLDGAGRALRSRHAHSLRVRLVRSSDALCVTIVGFCATAREPSPSNSCGGDCCEAIRGRIAALGGTLETGPDRTVRITIPEAV